MTGGSTQTTSFQYREVWPDLGLGAISGEDLVRASFLFLLDREPATSVLAEFSLDLIPRYFPEYRNEIRKYT